MFIYLSIIYLCIYTYIYHLSMNIYILCIYDLSSIYQIFISTIIYFHTYLPFYHLFVCFNMYTFICLCVYIFILYLNVCMNLCIYIIYMFIIYFYIICALMYISIIYLYNNMYVLYSCLLSTYLCINLCMYLYYFHPFF